MHAKRWGWWGGRDTQEGGALIVNIWAVWNKAVLLKWSRCWFSSIFSSVYLSCHGSHLNHLNKLHTHVPGHIISTHSTTPDRLSLTWQPLVPNNVITASNGARLHGHRWLETDVNYFKTAYEYFRKCREERKNTRKMASCYSSRPGFQVGWVPSADTTECSFRSAGAGQLWAAEAAPLLLQRTGMGQIEANRIKIQLSGTSSHLNNPIYHPLTALMCQASQTN